jgi:hypothetical protein
MKELKDIDRLFQEKFKDFEAHPPAEVWDKIAKNLDADKNKKRIIPWWYWTSGVAALFIMGFLGLNLYTNSSDLNDFGRQNKVVNTELETEVNKKEVDGLNVTDSNPQNAVTTLDGNGVSVTPTSESGNLSNDPLQRKISPTTKISNLDQINQKTSKVAASSNRSESTKSKKKNLHNTFSNEDVVNALPNKRLNNLDDKQSDIVESNSKPHNSLNNNIIENESSVVDNPTQLLVSQEINELERLLQEKMNSKDVVETKEKPEQRWLLNTVVAPVGFGTTGTGSMLDPALAANEKSYEMSVSYGVGMQYKVDKKLTVRTGVNRVTLGYNTNDLDFMPNMSARRLQNVNHTPQGSTISVQTKGGVTSFVENPVSMPNGGFLNQRMGFVEIPTEVSYRLFGSKMGVTLIGGFSSLFLTENRIEAVAHSFQTNLGEANNINSVSFSSNIGIGLEYAFLKNFQAQIEPMFKYQFNTFRGDVGNVRPYFFGIYSGVSYKF